MQIDKHMSRSYAFNFREIHAEQLQNETKLNIVMHTGLCELAFFLSQASHHIDFQFFFNCWWSETKLEDPQVSLG